MRSILIASAASAALTVAVSIAKAEPYHYAGGPVSEGNLCWIWTNDLGYGYWTSCPRPAKPMKMKKKAI